MPRRKKDEYKPVIEEFDETEGLKKLNASVEEELEDADIEVKEITEKHVTDEEKELIKNEENAIAEFKLEKIEQEIKKQNTITDEKQSKMNSNVFKNLLIAILIVLYFIFVTVGYRKLQTEIYLTDIRVFSSITLGITLVLFEIAYKKDSDELALYGVESLVISITTLLTIYILQSNKGKYVYIMNTISLLFAIYYVAKSIVIYVKMKKKALKKAKGIYKIGRIKE